GADSRHDGHVRQSPVERRGGHQFTARPARTVLPVGRHLRKGGNGKEKLKALSGPGIVGREVDPKQIIPLEDEQFGEF
ncbi:MAG TPA: hypothetical protein DCZ69_11350, partial [Syntrophobacteraceae bacterium]|nr:hypothetical protein [Syntrophobacteraceae bacterium]